MKNNQTIKLGRGGSRPGAGRKANTPNKASIERQVKTAETGETPLDYMLRVMRDGGADPKRRDEMARAAAAFVHPKLSSIEAKVDDRRPQRPSKIENVIVDPADPDASRVPAPPSEG